MDNDLYIVGTGTSLDDFDLRWLAGRHTIALNHALRYVPESDWWAASDKRVTAEYADQSISRFTTPILHCERSRDPELATAPWYWRAAFYDVVTDPNQMAIRPRALYQAATVATAALSLAWRLKYARVYLLGVDGYSLGEHKYFYDNKIPGKRTACGSYRAHAGALARLANWLGDQPDAPEVILLSPDSPISSFPRAKLSDLSSCLGRPRVVQPTK